MIKIVDLQKAFGSNHVLRGVNLEIKKGESMVIIGGSGSGKSVLIKHIIGLLRPDSGYILLNGTNVTSLKEKKLYELRRRFGMLFQSAALFDSLTVWENVAFALMRQGGILPKDAKSIAVEKLKLVGLIDVEELMPSALSGGMRKRVGLARALAHGPEIIIYDEPTTGLDPIMADAINNLIVELKEKVEATSIAITHDMNSAYKIADRIAMLYKGKIIETGTPEEIRNTSAPIVKQFITGSAHGPITDENRTI